MFIPYWLCWSRGNGPLPSPFPRKHPPLLTIRATTLLNAIIWVGMLVEPEPACQNCGILKSWCLLRDVAEDGREVAGESMWEKKKKMRILWQKYWCFTTEETAETEKKAQFRAPWKRPAAACKKEEATWRIFSLKELHAATNNFNYDHKIGEGGFGSVYWGQLASGDQIAVKRLKVWSTKAEMEFAVEVEVLGRVRHKNLLSLRGYCAEGQERLIVYDYMPKLSLLSHLHGQFAANSTLTWPTRMKIAIGSAEGLAYLHHYATPHIIHRDVKASNVLLDENFEAQVADFGFAKLVPDGATHITTRVKGTLGYLAPEYAMWGKVSESCDVYSFGILVLELVSGKKPIERVSRSAKRTIVEWARPLVLQRRYRDLVDPKLQGRFKEDELARLVQIAALCAQSSPKNRPTMQEVVEMLTEGLNEKRLSEEGNPGLPLSPVKYDPALLAADDGAPGFVWLNR